MTIELPIQYQASWNKVHQRMYSLLRLFSSEKFDRNNHLCKWVHLLIKCEDWEEKITVEIILEVAREGTMNNFVVMDGPGFMKNGPKRGPGRNWVDGMTLEYLIWPNRFLFLALLSCMLACRWLHVPSPPGICSTVISSTVVPTQLLGFVVLYQLFRYAHHLSHFPMLSLAEKSCSLNNRPYDGWLELFSITKWFSVPRHTDRQRLVHSSKILVSQGQARLESFGNTWILWSSNIERVVL